MENIKDESTLGVVRISDEVVTVAVEYGINIPEVISLVQENVKKTVEAMTGLNVEAVNVNVQNIYVPKKEQNLEKEV